MDSKNKVQQSNDEHIDEDFPGYPHYPAKEDVMNPQNKTERINANVENLSHDGVQNEPVNLDEKEADKKKVATTVEPEEITGASPDETAGKDNINGLDIVMGTEADVTEEDKRALGDPNRDLDSSVDEEIFSEGSGSAFEGTENPGSDYDSRDLRAQLQRTGDDLDVPGEELDDANEKIGEEDEENNYYSLGGDRHDNLEDDPTAAY